MTFARVFAVAAILSMVLPVAAATAEPIDTWDLLVGIDCVGDRFNPTRDDGTKDPNADPAPGSPEWTERDDERLACDNQRDADRRAQPPHVNAHSVARYGEDWYRQPFLLDDVRFRFDVFPLGTAGLLGDGVPAFEVYRPCSNAPGACPELPEGLERFDPPYPVVIIHHGFIAQMTHHRFNAQPFAEAGYLAIVVNGTHPITGLPNVQRNENANHMLNWLASEDSGDIGDEADFDRVALAGHSQGSAASLSYQGDPRVHAILAWDGGDGISDLNCTEGNPCAPIMYQRTDGAFSAPQNTARTDYPEGRHRGQETYELHRERGMDVFHVTFRATNHIDWNGNGIGSLAGNRLAELVINHYSLAWLDRHLKGRLVLDETGAVETSEGRNEAEERAFRQTHAQGAFDRLTALEFDDSADRHNISMGFYDPVDHVTSVVESPTVDDLLYGGNVPYSIEGLWVTDRLAQEYRSFCSVSVPDYVNGSDGTPGSATAATADSGVDGDMRFTGCPQASGGPDDPGDDVAVSCLDCDIQVRAGESGTARLKVSNNGSNPIDVTLEAAAPNGWQASVTPASDRVAAGESIVVELAVTTPNSAKDAHDVVVTAITGGGAESSDAVHVEVTKGRPSDAGPPSTADQTSPSSRDVSQPAATPETMPAVAESAPTALAVLLLPIAVGAVIGTVRRRKAHLAGRREPQVSGGVVRLI